jgi:hypothetical protein
MKTCRYFETDSKNEHPLPIFGRFDRPVSYRYFVATKPPENQLLGPHYAS